MIKMPEFNGAKIFDTPIYILEKHKGDIIACYNIFGYDAQNAIFGKKLEIDLVHPQYTAILSFLVPISYFKETNDFSYEEINGKDYQKYVIKYLR